MTYIPAALFVLLASTSAAMAFDCPLGEQGSLVVSDWNTQPVESGTRIEVTLKNASGSEIRSAFGRLFIAPEAEPAGMIVIQKPLAIDEEVTIVNVAGKAVYGSEFDFEAAASRKDELVACLTSVEPAVN